MTREKAPWLTRSVLATLALGALSCEAKRSERACALLSLEDCASQPYCAVVAAARVDEERGCQHPSEAVACSALPDLDCGTALTLGRDGDGQLLWFTSTCVPNGFSPEDDPSLNEQASSWPDCE
jgi:hypothetical protein